MSDRSLSGLEHVTLPIGSLVERKGNARKHASKQIKALADSMEEFGFTKPVVVDEKNVILAGHARARAAARRGDREVACVRVKGWDEESKTAFAIADNRMAELSEWDEELLESELQKIPDLADEFKGLIAPPPKEIQPKTKPQKPKKATPETRVLLAKMKFEVTEDQLEHLQRLLRHYVRKHSLKTGFWRWLLLAYDRATGVVGEDAEDSPTVATGDA